MTESNNKSPVELRSRRTRLRKLLRWAERWLAVTGLCFLLYHVAFQMTVMTSDSMAPTLQGTTYENGDRILLEKVSSYFRPPRRWEIYFFYNEDGTPVAKRVVGLPGERISIRNHQLYINGIELPRPAGLKAIKYYGYGNLDKNQEVNCGDGYFVLGDASIDSYDSRYIGVVKKEAFHGRVWCVVWPSARAGFVE